MAKTARVKQLENQLEANGKELEEKYRRINKLPLGDPTRVRLERRVKIVERASTVFYREYKKLIDRDKRIQHLDPMVINASNTAEKLNRHQRQALARLQQDKENRRLAGLIARGRTSLRELHSGVKSAYDSAHNSGFSNLIFSHWVRICGGANPRLLLILRDKVVPRARQSLQSADAARRNRNFGEARMHLKSAAETIKGLGEDLARFNNMIDSGGKQAEMYIQFYRDVAIAAVTGGSNLSLSVGQKAAVAAVGAGAGQGTELTTKALGGEQVTSKDFVAAAVDIGTSAASPVVGNKINAWFGGMAKKLGGRIATKAVERYVGPTLGPKQKEAVIKAVTQAVESRITALGSSQFSKIANSLAKKEKEPDWNWWENIIAPMVGGDLEGIVKQAAREVQMGKQAAK